MVQFNPKLDGAVDTLHITKAQWLEVLHQLEHQGMSLDAADHRHEKRVCYRVMMGMLVDIIHPGGSRATFLVRSRNLSQSGTGFLHGNFLHIGTRCTITLPHLDGQIATMGGKVVRCRHIQGKVHEIGVKFDKAITLDEFVAAK